MLLVGRSCGLSQIAWQGPHLVCWVLMILSAGPECPITWARTRPQASGTSALSLDMILSHATAVQSPKSGVHLTISYHLGEQREFWDCHLLLLMLSPSSMLSPHEQCCARTTAAAVLLLLPL